MTKKVEIEEKEIEAPYELPEGWKWVRLGDVAEIARGGSPRPIEKYITTSEDGINWIKIGDTEKDGKYIFSTKEKIVKEGLSKTRYVEEGDFLLTNSMSFGRPYILKTSGCIHDGWLVIKKCSAYNQDFLYYLLSSPLVFQKFTEIAKGSTVKNLKSETVRQVVLPLPTLAEQQRIVNRIESMFAKLDEAKEKAQNVVDSFETRKAAILHQAFTGELTAKWRKENGVADDSWEERTLDDIAEYKKGPFGSSITKAMFVPKSNNTYKVYEQGNAIRKTINYGSYYITQEKYNELKSFAVQPNDIIISCAGTIGEVFKLPNEIEQGVINQALMRVRIKSNTNEKFFIYYFGEVIKGDVQNKSNGTAIQNIPPFKIMKAMTINLPSLPEQQEIVRILDTVLEKESRAKEAAQTVLDQIALLKKSILARAFRGDL